MGGCNDCGDNVKLLNVSEFQKELLSEKHIREWIRQVNPCRLFIAIDACGASKLSSLPTYDEKTQDFHRLAYSIYGIYILL